MALATAKEMVVAWQTTLAKYQKLREEATDPKQKSRYTREINRCKKTIEAFKRADDLRKNG